MAMLTHLCVGFCPIPDKSRGLNLVDANTAMFTDTVMGHSSGYRRGVDVNARERLDGWTPLHLLCTMHQHPDQAGLTSMAEAVRPLSTFTRSRDDTGETEGIRRDLRQFANRLC